MGRHVDRLARVPSLAAALACEDNIAAASALIGLGLPLFPVHSVDALGRCSCGAACGRDAGKHPRTERGLLDATTHTRQITAWWRRWPDANLAVATGANAGVWVLDIDPGTGGEESIATLEAVHGEIPATWCVETGGGGLHLWFLMPDAALRNSAGRLGPGLDVRADGGYVIVPPSRHRSGTTYRWAAEWHPTRVELTPAPSWLLDLACQATGPRMIPPDRSPIGRRVGGNHSQPLPTVIAEGARNATLTSLAGAMRRKGCGEAAILAALSTENAERCIPPLPEPEITRIARSVSRYAATPDLGLSCRPSRSRTFVEFIDGKAVAR
ncbi:MAG: bifunctional DNA primase/polymerase [Rhizobiales bacterium]|nr:bifunctional DNA primase/polymerase [Hyphomicrobiales bacterium]